MLVLVVVKNVAACACRVRVPFFVIEALASSVIAASSFFWANLDSNFGRPSCDRVG